MKLFSWTFFLCCIFWPPLQDFLSHFSISTVFSPFPIFFQTFKHLSRIFNLFLRYFLSLKIGNVSCMAYMYNPCTCLYLSHKIGSLNLFIYVTHIPCVHILAQFSCYQSLKICRPRRDDQRPLLYTYPSSCKNVLHQTLVLNIKII